MRSAEAASVGMEAVSVVATESMAGPRASPTLADDVAIGEDGAPGSVAAPGSVEDEEEEVTGSVGVSESEGLPG